MSFARYFWLVFLLAGIGTVANADDASVAGNDRLADFERTVLTTDDGTRMNCSLRAGAGPVVVWVPGTWGDLHSLTPLIVRLPEDQPVGVIELGWQGGNVPPRTDYTIEELADDVLWAIDKLGIDDFYISGHSLGGMIAVEIAGREIDGLRGAIPMEGWTHHTVVQTAFDGVVVGELTPAVQQQAQAGRERGLRHLSEEQRKAIASIWRRWNGYEGLQRSRVPILQVWGDRGKPHATLAQLQIPDRPNIEIAWMPGASHKVLLESPDALAKAVIRFIERMQ